MRTNHCFKTENWCRHHESNAGPTDYKLAGDLRKIKGLSRFFVPKKWISARFKSITCALLCLSFLGGCAAPARTIPHSVLWDDLNRPADLSKPFDWGIAEQRYR